MGANVLDASTSTSSGVDVVRGGGGGGGAGPTGRAPASWASGKLLGGLRRRASGGPPDTCDLGPPVAASSLASAGCVGEGAFATVEKAWFTPAPGAEPQLVALKRPKQAVREDAAQWEAFVREVSLMRRLRHRNLVGFVGAGAMDPKDPSTAFVLQEFMGGGTLRALVLRQMRQNPIPLYSDAAAVGICLQIARGLQYMHQTRPMVIHRDLKLENIMLENAGAGAPEGLYVAKIADFGLSRAVGGGGLQRVQSDLTQRLQRAVSWDGPDDREGSGRGAARRKKSKLPRSSSWALWESRIISGVAGVGEGAPEVFDFTAKTGSLMYMPPEVYRGECYNEKADVFSFGVMMYEVVHRYLVLSAITMKGHASEVEVYASNVASGYRPPIVADLPDALRKLIQRCWAQDHAARPSMAVVADELARIQRNEKMCTKAAHRPHGACCVIS